MADNEKLTNRVREALKNVSNVKEKRMFGRIMFMVNGKMCISSGDDQIMCRIDPVLHDTVIRKKGVESVIMRGREYKGYVHIKEDVIKNKKDFNYWIGLALDFNEKAKAISKKKK